MVEVVRGADGIRRCAWAASTEEYARYHDHEWGRPVVDDVRLYEKLLADAGIVRHRGKIEAAIANARATLDVQARHGSLAALCWAFEPPARRRAPRALAELPPATPESKALSKALLRAGFRYVGPTTVYAMMQATGIVNDHLAGCPARRPCTEARRALDPPRVAEPLG
jgi:DNA-3-methyladenine glycosylase I